MKKQIIIEELNRMKLMMGYNPKNTLTENTVISEQAWKVAAEDLGRLIAKDETAVTRSLEGAVKDGTIDMKNMVLQDGTRLSKISDVLDALKAGTLGPSGTGSVAKGLFLKGASSEIRIAGAEAITSMGKFSKEFSNLSREQIVDRLVQSGKWSREDAEVLADTYLKKRGGARPIEPEPINPEPVRIEEPIPPKPTWWRRSWDWLTKTKWGRRIMVAGGLLAAYYLFIKGDDDDFPECLKGYIESPEEFEKFLNDGYIIIEGDEANGMKYQIYPDGKVVVTFKGGGTAEGEWEEVDGNVIANVKGVKRLIPCKGQTNTEDCPSGYHKDENGDCVQDGGGGGGGGSYKDCTDFPFTQGCKSDKIREIQGCIGATADGKYGPKTKSALEAKGYSTTITKDVYDKIMKDCGKTNTEDDGTTPTADTSGITTID